VFKSVRLPLKSSPQSAQFQALELTRSCAAVWANAAKVSQQLFAAVDAELRVEPHFVLLHIWQVSCQHHIHLMIHIASHQTVGPFVILDLHTCSCPFCEEPMSMKVT
jgi:hypothetical protein